MNMDRLRFRIWDNDKNKMDYGSVYSLGWNPYTEEPYLENGDEDDFYIEIVDRFIIQQGTGQKDKHGVPIFEGDILSDGEHVAIVEWITRDDGYDFTGFRCNRDGKELLPHQSYPAENSTIEIIGNIFQTPELAK